MIEVGTRVISILMVEGDVVKSFGEGVYAGRFPLPAEAGGLNFGQENPRIDLDSGKTVWGCEGWWDEAEKLRQKYHNCKWETIDIDEEREREIAQEEIDEERLDWEEESEADNG